MVVHDATLNQREELQTATKELTTVRLLRKDGVAADVRVLDQVEVRRVLDHAA